jgi:hypothetical protein
VVVRGFAEIRGRRSEGAARPKEPMQCRNEMDLEMDLDLDLGLDLGSELDSMEW